MKFILFSKEAFEKSDFDNVLQCGQLNDTILEERGVFDLMGIWDDINTYAQEKFLFANDCYLVICHLKNFTYVYGMGI